jgi:hypothetical protein
VALSHTVALEEWQSLRDRLVEQHSALLNTKHGASMVKEATHSVQSAICGSMQRKMNSVAGLLSMLRHGAAEHGMHFEQSSPSTPSPGRACSR